MRNIVETGLGIIFGIWLLNFTIEMLFGIDLVGEAVQIIKKWAGDCDDPA